MYLNLGYSISCNGSDEHINVRYVLAATAYSMFARYILSAHTFMESYRDVHGPDTPSLVGTELDILHRMAGRMGYPADAARRFFDNVVVRLIFGTFPKTLTFVGRAKHHL